MELPSSHLGGISAGTTMERFGGTGLEEGMAPLEGLNPTQNASRGLCLWGLLLKAELLPFKTPFFAAGFEHP